MKRLFPTALLSSLVLFGVRSTQADELVIPGFSGNASTIDLQCETPGVLVCPAPVSCIVPQTVRRIVPRTTYHTVTRTVMVPEQITELRHVQNIEYRDEVRERFVTVMEQVPEIRNVTTEHTVMVPEQRVREERFTVQVPVERQVAETFTVEGLHTETRTGTRQISRCVPTTETRTVVKGGEIQKRCVKCADGRIKEQTVVVGGCQTQERVTVMKKQLIEQTIAYDVQVSRPETRTRLVTKLDYQPETRTRTVTDVVKVPKTETRTHQVTEIRSVPRQTRETFTERVPHVVTKTISVPVTKMVARQVCEQVPVTVYDVIEEPLPPCAPCQTEVLLGR